MGDSGHRYLRKRILERAGVVFNPIGAGFAELRRTEWSPEFERLMRNRLMMGAYRYGRLGAPEKPDYDRLEGIRIHLKAYRKDGNKEHLVDISNLALCEFVEGDGPGRYFRSVDDGEHVPEK